MTRCDHRLAAGLTFNEVSLFIDAILAMVEPIETHFLWRPQLRDAADELVLALGDFRETDVGQHGRFVIHRSSAPLMLV